MERIEAWHILEDMWKNATAEQAKALSIAMDDIEFVDLMPDDIVAVVRCKDCVWFNKAGCAIFDADYTENPKENDFCSYGERRK